MDKPGFSQSPLESHPTGGVNWNSLCSTDTIAAIATPRGKSAIGIVRLSGVGSSAIADKVFRPSQGTVEPSQRESRKLIHGNVVDPESGESIDEALMVLMRAPHSYTGEDMLEIQTHGSVAVLDRTLEILFAAGARPARPGEFTLRAFVNGRLTLTQAEAVADLIEARTQEARKMALQNLRGEASTKVKSIRDNLEDILVQLEASIDFPSEDLESESSGVLSTKLQDTSRLLEQLFLQSRIRVNQLEGLRTPICGKRNVGKSSLLNRLLGRDRALVTPHPGTTRDTVEEDAVLEGVLLHLSDTAGIGETEDPVELLGLQRTNEAIQDADIILFVVDISEPISREDYQVFSLIKEHFPRRFDERVLLLANKMDCLGSEDERNSTLDSLRQQFASLTPLLISALTGEGINTLCRRLAAIAHHEQAEVERPGASTHASQRILLREAAEAVTRALPLIQPPQDNPELAVVEIRTALDCLEELDGVKVCPDVLESIFSRFCIGK